MGLNILTLPLTLKGDEEAEQVKMNKLIEEKKTVWLVGFACLGVILMNPDPESKRQSL